MEGVDFSRVEVEKRRRERLGWPCRGEEMEKERDGMAVKRWRGVEWEKGGNGDGEVVRRG